MSRVNIWSYRKNFNGINRTPSMLIIDNQIEKLTIFIII